MIAPTTLPAGATSLRGASFAELEALFATLAAADHERVAGTWRGHVVAVAGVERLPTIVRHALAPALGALDVVWRGKRLDADGGVNLWLPAGPLTLAAFRSVPPSGAAGGSLGFDYDVGANPGPLRAIRGEARTLAPGALLARMGVRLGGARFPLLWFTLER